MWLTSDQIAVFFFTPNLFPNTSYMYLECSKQLWKRPCEFLDQLGFSRFIGTLQKMFKKKIQEYSAGSNSYVYVVLTKAIRCSYALQRLFEIPSCVIYDKCCDVLRSNGIINNIYFGQVKNHIFERRDKYLKTLKIIVVMDAT